jgi:hypothetical protein
LGSKEGGARIGKLGVRRKRYMWSWRKEVERTECKVKGEKWK